MDWQNKLSPSRLVQRIMTHLQPEGIIILHDTKHNTARALPEILKKLTENGYTIKKLSERKTLPGLDRYPFKQPQLHHATFIQTE